jgi:predicted nucleotidyltransferase
VKVTSLDREAVRKNLERAIGDLVRQRPEIERVILFGSLTRGRAVPGSDVDLLFVLSSSELPFLARIPLYIPEGCMIGVDVFPYTKAEVDDMLASGNSFVTRALSEGVEIYSR